MANGFMGNGFMVQVKPKIGPEYVRYFSFDFETEDFIQEMLLSHDYRDINFYEVDLDEIEVDLDEILIF